MADATASSQRLPGFAPAVSLSSTEVCEMTGLSMRQLHYVVEHGVVLPRVRRGLGTGNDHAWGVEQVRHLSLVRHLRDYGARYCTITRAVEELSLMEATYGVDALGVTAVVVNERGELRRPLAGRSNGWLVHLSTLTSFAPPLAAAS